jgi:hypothetical protein
VGNGGAPSPELYVSTKGLSVTFLAFKALA